MNRRLSALAANLTGQGTTDRVTGSAMSKLLLMEPRTCYCSHCGQPMKLVRTTPPVGTWPALLTFYCSSCLHTQIKEDRPSKATESPCMH